MSAYTQPRKAFVLTGDVQSARDTARAMLRDFDAARCLWVGADAPPEFDQVDAARADAVGGLGLVARQRGRLGEAMRRLREAAHCVQEGSSPRQHAQWLIELAEVQALQGAEGAALQTHARILELAAAEPGCLRERVRSLCAIGSLLAAQGRIDDAQEKVGEATQLARRAGMTAELALALNGEAETMMGAGQPAPAADALRPALEVNLRAGAPDSVIARNRNNLAVAYEQDGEFDLAEQEYKRALDLDSDNVYIRQNYELFREAYEKRKRKEEKSNP